MNHEFKKGYILYESDEITPGLACPHSGPSLNKTVGRDNNSETAAFSCWKRIGGKLLVSTVPREQRYGIDFNRDIPPKHLAINLHNELIQEYDYTKLHEFKKKYAWLAKDDNDYYKRLNIYQNFWSELEDSDKILLFHKAFTKMKAIPSILDIIPIKGNQTLLNSIVQGINKKYEPFLKGIERDFKQAVLIETKRTIRSLTKYYGEFDVKLIDENIHQNFKKDLDNLLRYANSYTLKKLKEHWSIHNYMEAIRSALNNSPSPHVTVAHVHNASLAHGAKRKLLNTSKKLVLELEINEFAGFWHAEKIAEIIADLYQYLN